MFISLLAILTALTTVATIVLIVPFPTTAGYFNLGDALVMISGFLLGPIGGFIAGGGGSAIADIAVGYTVYAPITLIAKGFEGMCVGYLSSKTFEEARLSGWDVAGVIMGSIVMMLGYLLGETFLLGYSFGAAMAELITVNSIQVLVGSIVTLTVGPVIRIYMRGLSYGLDESETPFEND